MDIPIDIFSAVVFTMLLMLVLVSQKTAQGNPKQEASQESDQEVEEVWNSSGKIQDGVYIIILCHFWIHRDEFGNDPN